MQCAACLLQGRGQRRSDCACGPGTPRSTMVDLVEVFDFVRLRANILPLLPAYQGSWPARFTKPTWGAPVQRVDQRVSKSTKILSFYLVLTPGRKFFSDELQQFHIVRKLPSGVNANDLRRRPILHNIGVVEAVGERKIFHTRSMVRNEANSEELVITTKAPMVETITGHGT
jgi:hypothetical protein